MSDCFPSFLHFGRVSPVEEINKFQGDISFFSQKKKEKKPPGSLHALILTFFLNLSLNKGNVLCQRSRRWEIS